MCGRFAITADRIESILNRFKAVLAPGFEGYQPRYNAAPAQLLPVIVSKEDGQRYLMNAFWGFIPPWGEKESGQSSYQINIRDDTIAKNRFFRDRLIRNRCILPADGFYEWKKPEGYDEKKKRTAGLKKTPYYIRLKNCQTFALAGLWRTVKMEDKIITTTAIITTKPNRFISPVHDRMPVILNDEELEIWLKPAYQDFTLLHKMLDPYPDDNMEAYAVSAIVNNGRNDSPACIEPLS